MKCGAYSIGAKPISAGFIRVQYYLKKDKKILTLGGFHPIMIRITWISMRKDD